MLTFRATRLHVDFASKRVGFNGKVKTDSTAKAKITEENFSDELKERLENFKNRILKA